MFNGRRYICPTAENFLDGRHKVRGYGALEYEARSAGKPDLRNDGRFVVNAEDDQAQIGMALHQVPCYVRFSITGERQVYDHQVGLEGYDSLHQGPLVSHHQHGLEQRIEKSVSPTQDTQMTIRQKDASVFHDPILTIQINSQESPDS
jgi:hypothetical protein